MYHTLLNRLRAFRYAFAGLGYLIRTQPNARIHALATGIVIVFGVWLKLTRDEWAWMMVAMGLVWIMESANTALEALVDLVAPEPHPLAKVAKDCAAAAVLIAAGMAAALGVIILGPPLAEKLGF